VRHTAYNPQDLAHDERWPEFGSRVSADLGINSCVSMQLVTDLDHQSSSLNVYSRQPGGFDRADLATCLLYSTNAALVVTSANAHEKIANLERALDTSREIGTAVGVLMARYRVTSDQAFNMLRLASQSTNRKLYELAVDVVSTGDLLA
jgi:hypothetical protein